MRDGALTVMAEQRQEGEVLGQPRGLGQLHTQRLALPLGPVELGHTWTMARLRVSGKAQAHTQARTNERHAEWDVQTAVFSMGLTSTKAKLVPAQRHHEMRAISI
jgi:hypothetical protein